MTVLLFWPELQAMIARSGGSPSPAQQGFVAMREDAGCAISLAQLTITRSWEASCQPPWQGVRASFHHAYVANDAALSTLLKLVPGTDVFLDEKSHASMIEGIRAETWVTERT
jgi:hypothetical protein